MGLGKTMQAIALMRGNPLKTLIITTVPTMTQWQSALYDFGGFRPLIVSASYQGILPEELEVVVTGYSSFQTAKGPTCLKDYTFDRIILDEGHTIRNPKTKMFSQINELKGRCRWILSGTPIQNSTKDITTLATWIGIDTSMSVEDITNEFMLRRTQEQEAANNPQLSLPDLTTEVKRLSFKYPEEKKLYKEVERYFEEQMAEVSSSRRYTTAIEGITRCRQICTHPQLYLDGMAKKDKKITSKKRRIEDSEDEDSYDNPQHKNKPMPESMQSTKMEYLVQELYERSQAKDKCLVFCHWTMEMKLLQQELKKKNVAALIFDGKLSRAVKDSVLYNFKHSTIPVLLLQIVCGSTGLNLQVRGISR